MSVRWQPVGDLQVCVLALMTMLGVWVGSRVWQVGIALAVLWMLTRRARVPIRRDLAVVTLVLVVAGGVSSARAWAAAHPRALGPFQGWATVMSDPVPFGAGLRVVLEIEGERFDATVYGSARRRLEPRQAGERVEIVGERRAATGPWARRSQVRHVVGEVTIDRVGAWSDGTPMSLASNRLRRTLRDSAERSMPADRSALFTGLVIGDDTRQPPRMIDEFRASGLSHLTAVSGQNVAFVLAVVGIGLRSLSRWWRLGATCAVIAWFVVLTRVEPSVLRAGTMAAFSAVGFALGRERTATRTLGLAVIVLVLFDPLLVWSVGFWLSVGATFGVSAIAPRIEPLLRGPHWLVAPLSVTLGAQIGVLAPSWLVFGRMPPLGIVANLLAVPVAGFVMLYGIPAGLVGALPVGVLGEIVMWPASVGTRWVATVAGLTARLQPTGRGAVAVWLVQLGLLAVLLRPDRAREGAR
ncbi:MAG: ComEC/Rec2 family competence protein [Ilumatobacteraceae bacterium]